MVEHPTCHPKVQDKHGQDWLTTAMKRNRTVWSGTRSWFLREEMDFEILIQAAFNESILSRIKGTKDYNVLDCSVVEHPTCHPKVQGKHGQDWLMKAIR